jgi:hypothetical protein
MNAESSRPARMAPILGSNASRSAVTSRGPWMPASPSAAASFGPRPGQSRASQNAMKIGSGLS